MKQIFFRNKEQLALFQYFILPEITDGYWKNAKPHLHHQPWEEAVAAIDSDSPGRMFKSGNLRYNICRGDFVLPRYELMLNLLNLMDNGWAPELANRFCDDFYDSQSVDIIHEAFGSQEELNKARKGNWTKRRLLRELADMQNIMQTELAPMTDEERKNYSELFNKLQCLSDSESQL